MSFRTYSGDWQNAKNLGALARREVIFLCHAGSLVDSRAKGLTFVVPHCQPIPMRPSAGFLKHGNVTHRDINHRSNGSCSIIAGSISRDQIIRNLRGTVPHGPQLSLQNFAGSPNRCSEAGRQTRDRTDAIILERSQAVGIRCSDFAFKLDGGGELLIEVMWTLPTLIAPQSLGFPPTRSLVRSRHIIHLKALWHGPRTKSVKLCHWTLLQTADNWASFDTHPGTIEGEYF